MRHSCRDIMIANPTTLHPKQTLNKAIAAIHNSGVRYLPVVDDNGDFVGLFSTLELLERLLPQSIMIKMGSQVGDLNFMRTSIEELQEKLEKIGNEPVSQHMLTHDIVTCSPDSSIMEALYMLQKHHTHVVLTEKGTKKFIGVVTINGLIDKLQPQNIG